ncbi:DUF7691 family protein [Streptomyces sp. SBT349]|uniref:DUF7691 family protein n=1 Tax=Streptomyces sp. SBT349 TaxID=1580539 RepID=UPI00066D0433|nr:hypothetical protein [Streptomyces sp. SBT349]
MSTTLHLYSTNLRMVRELACRPPGWLLEGCRARAAERPGVAEGLDGLFASGEGPALAWEAVVRQAEGTAFAFGPLRLGSRLFAETSEEMERLGVDGAFTPLGFLYRSPFPGTEDAGEAPAVGHLPAPAVAGLRDAYRQVLGELASPARDMAEAVLKAADETVHFNAFADRNELPHQDLVTFHY